MPKRRIRMLVEEAGAGPGVAGGGAPDFRVLRMAVGEGKGCGWMGRFRDVCGCSDGGVFRLYVVGFSGLAYAFGIGTSG